MLLKRAISQSGTAYSPYAIMREPLLETVYLSRRVNCPGNENVPEMVTCLQNTNAEKLIGEMPFLFVSMNKQGNTGYGLLCLVIYPMGEGTCHS